LCYACKKKEILERYFDIKNDNNVHHRRDAIEEIREKTKDVCYDITALSTYSSLKPDYCDCSSQTWYHIHHINHCCLTKEDIFDFRDQLIALALKSRRELKRDKEYNKRKREEEDSSPNKKPNVGKDFQNLKNGVLSEVDNNTIAAGLKESVGLEGEKDFEVNQQIKNGEEKLIEDNFELYKGTVIVALEERLNDQGIKEEELDEETKKLLKGEITDKDQFKSAKNRAVKKIGEMGAKSR